MYGVQNDYYKLYLIKNNLNKNYYFMFVLAI